MTGRGRLLILWNQVEEDIYERWREEGPRRLAWDPTRVAPDVGTVAEEMTAMIRALERAGFTVHVVNVEDDLDRVIHAIRLYRPDAVFNLVEYFNDDAVQEAYIAGLYELLGVHYTGNTPLTLTTCQNKYRTKLLLDAAELPTSPYILVNKLPVPTDHELQFPLIVKPAMEDASGGIEPASVVLDQAGLEAQVTRVLREFEMPVLVEEYIDGREIHAAVLGNESPEVLPLFEMEFDDSEFNPTGEWRPQIISYRAKWDPHSQEFYSMDAVCPAEDLDEETEEYIRDVARRAFRATGCRDYARVDMRLDEEEGEVYILEVNPNPDLSDGAAYMMCATASGRTFSQTLAEIADMAVGRMRRFEAKLRAAETVAKPSLPSDHLLREWTVQQAMGDEAVLPVSSPSVGSAHTRPSPDHMAAPRVVYTADDEDDAELDEDDDELDDDELDDEDDDDELDDEDDDDDDELDDEDDDDDAELDDEDDDDDAELDDEDDDDDAELDDDQGAAREDEAVRREGQDELGEDQDPSGEDDAVLSRDDDDGRKRRGEP